MESETARRLFERLKQLRQERGLTQEAFAEQAGIKYKYYQSVEAGRKPDLRISTVERLAKGHGLEPWELLLPANLTPMVAELQAKFGRRRGKGK